MTLLKYIKKHFPENPSFTDQSSIEVDKILKEFKLRLVYPQNKNLNYKSGVYDLYILGDMLAAISVKDLEQPEPGTDLTETTRIYKEKGIYAFR